MSMKNTISRELELRPILRAGYSRKMAGTWYKKTKADAKNYKGVYSDEYIKKVHRSGYLCGTLDKYGLDYDSKDKIISNFSYIYMEPFNNSFSKWMQDMVTTNAVLKDHSDCLREVYFTVSKRNGHPLILSRGENTKKYTADDIVELLKEKKILQLRPAFWLSKKARHDLEYIDDQLYVDGVPADENKLDAVIAQAVRTSTNYVVSEYVDLKFHQATSLEDVDHYVKFWITNDSGEGEILSTVMNVLWHEYNIDEKFEEEDPDDVDDTEESLESEEESVKDIAAAMKAEENQGGKESKIRRHDAALIDIETGAFTFNGETIVLEHWTEVKEEMLSIANSLSKLSYFTISIALKGDGKFKILSMSANPILPQIPFNDELVDYLKKRAELKHANRPKLTMSNRIKAIKKSRFDKYVQKHCKVGMRPYMYALWVRSVWDDLWHTKMSIFKKRWAWKRGFLSFRIKQYGLTEENYKLYLSDYDYYWLNRINNAYQIWVNDKTTFRYTLDDFKEYIPDYYYAIYKRGNKLVVEKMQDCPDDIADGFDGIFQMLKREGKLALKPSAGTHGDGFYCLAFEDGVFSVNGEVMSEEEIIELVNSFKSFYLVTAFIKMNQDLKKIYDKSVNSIRVMVINSEGYNPKIHQSYMRIGSSRTGYTDNVGYGGICVMVDPGTGEMYNPETIVDHKFYPCPEHPDTGTPIAGVIPHWDLVREKVLQICRSLPELEYLGFDIAITDDAFEVIEINIHQDLQKLWNSLK